MAITLINGTLKHFNIIDLSPILWLDAADTDTITVDGSNNVSQWDDKSGNDQHALQAVEAKMPTLTTDPTNSLPAIYFPKTAGNEMMAGTFAVSLSSEFLTIVTVAGNTTIGGPIISSDQDVTFNHFEHSNFTTAVYRVFSGNGASRDLPDLEWAVDSTVQVMATSTRNSTAANGQKGYTNGTFIFEQAATLISSNPGFFLGQRLSGGVPSVIRSYMQEIVLFDRVLLTDELAQLHAHLLAKWSLP